MTLPTPGPAVWPDVVTPSSTTYNPPVPENPVNGSAVANASCPAGVSDSNAVTFCPYRSSDQADTLGGEFPIPDAPVPIEDPPNCTRTASQFDPNIPTYDAFFGTTLGSGTTGNGLSGATPSAKKTAQLTAYMQAIVNAINSNPATTGTRVGIKMYQSGSSVLGVPFYVAVVGTPDNIANLDAGRNDAAFWRGVIDGTTSQADALSQVGVRPGFGWITGTPHGNEPAGGEASTKELYELAARTDCDNARRLGNLDVFIQPVTAPDDRDHNVRTTAWSFDPNRDRGTVQMPENKALLDVDRDVPGPLLHRRAPADVGLLLPAEPGRGAQRDLALRARRDPERHRPRHPAEVQRPDRAVPQLQHVRPLRPRVRRHRSGARHGRRRA